MEDALFAGAILELITEGEKYKASGDAATAASILWQQFKNNPAPFINSGKHFQKLRDLGCEDDIEYAFMEDTAPVIPVLTGDRFTIIK